MPESYQPGQRRKQFGQNHKISENRYAWVQCELGKFLILVGDDEGSGTDVVLFKPQPGKLPDIAWNLTNLTTEELNALEELIHTAFEWARPVVMQRDKEAEDAWNTGDDSHVRNYRPLPTVVYRKRPEHEHGQGLRERSDGVPEGGGGESRGHSGGVRGTGDELAQPDEDDGLSQDNSAATD